MGGWSVGEVARAAGVTVRALHHYERIGLLSSRRTASGHRRFTEEHIARLYRILALRDLGVPLAEIGSALDAGDLLGTVRLHRDRVAVQVAGQQRLARRLDELVERLGHGQPPDAAGLMEAMTMTVHLTRIYTRTGDDGRTDLSRNLRVDKTDPRVEALGALDELNAAVGIAASEDHPHAAWLRQVQNDLFDLGADVAAGGAATRVGEDYVTWLERRCDEANAGLEPLRSFVLPGAGHLHLCRAIGRRAERRILAVTGLDPVIGRYLNRLSDLLFILSRVGGDPRRERLWEPGRRPAG